MRKFRIYWHFSISLNFMNLYFFKYKISRLCELNLINYIISHDLSELLLLLLELLLEVLLFLSNVDCVDLVLLFSMSIEELLLVSSFLLLRIWTFSSFITSELLISKNEMKKQCHSSMKSKF